MILELLGGAVLWYALGLLGSGIGWTVFYNEEITPPSCSYCLKMAIFGPVNLLATMTLWMVKDSL